MTRQYQIPQSLVEEAWRQVKRKQGAAGIDGVTIEDFEKDLEDNIYKIWNRMTSGSYFPPPVRIVEIPKSSGGKRKLGIPTIADRVAQTVAKMYLEPEVEPKFHQDSFGYRPRRSQHDALRVTRERCWKYDWAVEIDIKGFFDDIDHELLMETVRQHTSLKWLLIYIERWLKAGNHAPDSTTITIKEKGSPQGSVISPILSNIFLHHAFDLWMEETHSTTPFERFADDIIIHCHTHDQAQRIKESVSVRLSEWKLQLNADKTRIVYCKDNKRTGKHKPIKLQFLGYEFKPRRAENHEDHSIFMSYLPAIGHQAKLSIYDQIRNWHLMKCTQQTLELLGERFNPQIRGWLNYFGKFYGSALESIANHLDESLALWAQRKYKKLGSHAQARAWLKRIEAQQPSLFAHWEWREKRRMRRAV